MAAAPVCECDWQLIADELGPRRVARDPSMRCWHSGWQSVFNLVTRCCFCEAGIRRHAVNPRLIVSLSVSCVPGNYPRGLKPLAFFSVLTFFRPTHQTSHLTSFPKCLPPPPPPPSHYHPSAETVLTWSSPCPPAITPKQAQPPLLPSSQFSTASTMMLMTMSCRMKRLRGCCKKRKSG
jgi:hypothetical protein